MKYIIIIAIAVVMGAVSLVEREPEATIQASVPVEFYEFETPMVIEVSNRLAPTTLFDDASDGGHTPITPTY